MQGEKGEGDERIELILWTGVQKEVEGWKVIQFSQTNLIVDWLFASFQLLFSELFVIF